MQFDLKLDHQSRAILLATAGAALAAIVAMLLPVGIWETLTGSTGVSELIPATAAPLGDTARALISFGFGALTFAILASVLLRRKIVKPATEAMAKEPIVFETDAMADDEEAGSSILAKLRDRVAAFVAARRGAGDVSTLEDLPKLRSGDAHPDAPPRRPLLATRDLVDPLPAAAGAVESDELAGDIADAEAEVETIDSVSHDEPAPIPEPHADVIEANSDETAIIADSTVEAVVPAPQEHPETPEISISSLSEMVDRLERAMAERDHTLSQLQALAVEQSAAPVASLHQVPVASITPEPVTPVLVEQSEAAEPQPTGSEAEEMDAALRSALDTLYRMNARTR